MELFFRDFVFPYGFYGPEEYGKWLKDAGFSVKRLELISKDMALEGEKGLSAYIASIWLPYIQLVPEELKQEFINQFVVLFMKNYPSEDKGYIHVQMKRLEIEAYPKK